MSDDVANNTPLQIESQPAQLGTCVTCGVLTSDWWYFNGADQTCKCRSCSQLGSLSISGRFPQMVDAEYKTTRNQKKANDQRRALANETSIERGSRFLPDMDMTYHSKVKIYANAVEVKKVKHQKQAPPPKNPRGAIVRFSPRSRSRMMRKVGTIRGMKKPYFITLTYPGEFEADPRRVKEHLNMLKKRIARRFERPGMVWRLELKTRLTGASAGQIVPHFHIILWGMEIYEASMWAIINKMWWEIVWESTATGNYMPARSEMTKEQADHALHGTDVEQLNDFNHVLLYVSKYAAKVEDDETADTWGRRWGVCLYSDTGHAFEIELTWEQHIALRRALRRLLEQRKSKYAWWLKSGHPDLGFTVLGVGDKDGDYESQVASLAMRIVAHTKGY